MIRLACSAVVWIAIGLRLGGCDQAARGDAQSWLAAMQSAHSEADRFLAVKAVNQARDALTVAWQAAIPAAVSAADRRAIRQDVAYRISELEVAVADMASAMTWADRGLALGQDETVMTANLLMLRGRLFERADQPRKAVADLHAALLINEKLLAKALEQP